MPENDTEYKPSPVPARQKFPTTIYGEGEDAIELIGIPKTALQKHVDARLQKPVDEKAGEYSSVHDYLDACGLKRSDFEWVRYAPMPEEVADARAAEMKREGATDDAIAAEKERIRLEGYLVLVQSFEDRFTHNALGGREESAYEKYKDTEAVKGWDPEKLATGLKSVAYQKSGVEKGKEHIRRRLAGEDPKSQEMEKLRQALGEDLNAFSATFTTTVRRKGRNMEEVNVPRRMVLPGKEEGEEVVHIIPDRDGITHEMKGEPYNLVIGCTQPAESNYARSIFHPHRFMKIAEAREMMSDMGKAMEAIVAARPELRETDLSMRVCNFVQFARDRVELMRKDPDYPGAHEALFKAYRDLRFFELPEKPGDEHMPTDMRQKTEKAMELLGNAADIIFDMAMVRGARRVTGKECIRSMQAEITGGMKRHTGGGS